MSEIDIELQKQTADVSITEMMQEVDILKKELLVLLEFEDSEYEKIIMCLNEEDKKVFVINNEIVTDKNLIDKVNKKYDLELPDELKGVIF